MKKQIPNLLSVIRLLLIPLFVVFFFAPQRVYAFIVFGTANLTDVIDGYLARKYNWVTNAGKILDPLADKLLQVTAAICLAISDRVYIALAVLLIVKELCMLVGGSIILTRTKIQVVSAWYGKAATVIYFAIVSIFILFPGIYPFDIILSVLLCCVFFTALVLYYLKMFKGQYGMNIFTGGKK